MNTNGKPANNLEAYITQNRPVYYEVKKGTLLPLKSDSFSGAWWQIIGGANLHSPYMSKIDTQSSKFFKYLGFGLYISLQGNVQIKLNKNGHVVGFNLTVEKVPKSRLRNLFNGNNDSLESAKRSWVKHLKKWGLEDTFLETKGYYYSSLPVDVKLFGAIAHVGITFKNKNLTEIAMKMANRDLLTGLDISSPFLVCYRDIEDTYAKHVCKTYVSQIKELRKDKKYSEALHLSESLQAIFPYHDIPVKASMKTHLEANQPALARLEYRGYLERVNIPSSRNQPEWLRRFKSKDLRGYKTAFIPLHEDVQELQKLAGVDPETIHREFLEKYPELEIRSS